MVKVDVGHRDQLNELYGGLKEIYSDSTIFQILYPREGFKLTNKAKKLRPEILRVFSHETGWLDVLTSHGDRFEWSGDDIDESTLRSSFAYRTNTQRFTAPQTTGVYYVYAFSEGMHHIIEIEVRVCRME